MADMFGLILYPLALKHEFDLREARMKQRKAAEGALSAEQYRRYRQEVEAAERNRMRQQTEERRHQELCEAIRSTSFWRFGS